MKLRREDVYMCNILCCRPPENRNPRTEESANCRPFLDRALDIVKPKVICCLGVVAAQNLLGKDEKIESLRGKVHEYKGVAVICTYHPAYLLRNPTVKDEVRKDLQFLMEVAKK